MILRFTGRKCLKKKKKTIQLFSRDGEDLGCCLCSAHLRKNSQTCLQSIEVTLNAF